MNIDEILTEWDKDSKIDTTDLGNESTKIPGLHAKYYRWFVNERLVLKRLEAKMKQLKLDKYEFFTQGPNEETVSKGWRLPPKGVVLKQDIPMYMDADKDIIELSLKIGYQQEIVDFLESIIKTFQGRGYNIKTAVDFLRFTNGG